MSLWSIRGHLPVDMGPVVCRHNFRRRFADSGLRSRCPLTQFSLTLQHRHCVVWIVVDLGSAGQCLIREMAFYATIPAFLSVLMPTVITPYVCGGRDLSSPILNLLLSTWCYSLGSDPLGHPITFSCGENYVDDILQPVVLPILSRPPGAIFQQDNGLPYTERLNLSVYTRI